LKEILLFNKLATAEVIILDTKANDLEQSRYQSKKDVELSDSLTYEHLLSN